MAKTLIDRIRAARQKKVKVGGFDFTIRRPTDMQMLEMQTKGQVNQRDILTGFVVDWGKMKELDLVPGGTGKIVPFDLGTFSEWIEDRPELWNDITNAIVNAYKEHESDVSETLKNSKAGS